jgi:hypothetical protein
MPIVGGTLDTANQPDQYVVPSGPLEILITPGTEVILTSGTDLDNAAQSSGPRGLPWPRIINGMVKFFNSWRPNTLRQVHNQNLNGNYGAITSVANFGFRGREFYGVGSYPQPTPYPWRPMWNNLIPIVWGLRDIDPQQLAQAQELMVFGPIQTNSSTFEPGGAASLQETLL